MAVLTNFLKLLKPEKNDYVDVDKHISENYDKIDNKMQELNTSNSGKLDKGALPTTIKSGKDLYDMLENNGGINIDTALLYLNDAGTKTAGKVYFDKNKKGLFECIKTTTNTVNSTEFFVDISNKASADRLTNLGCFSKKHMLTNDGPNGQGEYHTFVIEHNDFIEISLFIEKEFVVKPNVSTFKLPDDIKVSGKIELNGLGFDSNGKYFTSFFYAENNLIKTTHTANVKFAYFHGIGKKI